MTVHKRAIFRNIGFNFTTVTGASYALILPGSYRGGVSSEIHLPWQDLSENHSREKIHPTKLLPETFFTHVDGKTSHAR